MIPFRLAVQACSENGVCRADKDAPCGWGGPAPTLHAHGGGDPVPHGAPPHPLLPAGQHRRAVAPSFQHRLY